EHPRHGVSYYGDRPPPVGFGFTSPGWQPRSAYAGTYNQKWSDERMPLLPLDFDRRFFNGAPRDQVAAGFLKADEQVLVLNASPGGRLLFNLPGVPPPQGRIQLRGRRDERLTTRLDTVIINTDENLLLLIWRANLVLKTGPQDLVSMEVRVDGLRLPLAAE